MSIRDKYEVVIGLEVHAQLKTKSKIFAPDSTEFGAEPNTHTSPITLGMPGVLPVLNKEVVNMGILCGLALHCEIPRYCKFDRKQYGRIKNCFALYKCVRWKPGRRLYEM